jgi:phosphoribosyl-AMP cyclohydrolase
MSIAKEVTFGDDGLIPVAVTDIESGRLLVLCFMNAEALEKTLAEGKIHVYRRSKGEVVLKGVSSGHIQEVREIRLNCDGNSLEIRVAQSVAACAAGYFSCYYRTWDSERETWAEADERAFDPQKVYG